MLIRRIVKSLKFRQTVFLFLMALRAGASAVDMEFLLFIGTILEPLYAKGSLLPYLMSIPAMDVKPPQRAQKKIAVVKQARTAPALCLKPLPQEKQTPARLPYSTS